MEKRINIGMKILPSLLEAVDGLAEQENRTRSNTIEDVLLRWFREKRPDLLGLAPGPGYDPDFKPSP